MPPSARVRFAFLLLIERLLVSTAVRAESDLAERGDGDPRGGGPLEEEGVMWSVGEKKVGCCCKPGACKAGSTGARKYPARQWNASEGGPICCKERWKHCDRVTYPYSINGDARQCLPDEGNGRSRICFSSIRKMHMSVELGDGGCASLLEPDGLVKQDAQLKYLVRDCPFPGNSEENQVRRQLLLSFNEFKPASYVDVMHTCNPEAGQRDQWPDREPGPGLDLTLPNWSSLAGREPLRKHLDSLKGPEASDFVCRTLRLVPLLWTRIGMRSAGLTQDDDLHEHPFPRSRWGKIITSVEERPFKCTRYVDLSAESTFRARRVLRALIPTWSVHVFAQSKWGQNKKALLTLIDQVPPNPFHDELIRECEREDDEELVGKELISLQNGAVLMRDAGECKKRFPCAFLDKDCENSKACKCMCFKAVCWTFTGDFVKAMEETFKLQQCQNSFHKKMLAITG